MRVNKPQGLKMENIVKNSAYLLIAVAAADGDFEEKEKQQVIKALTELFDIGVFESEALIERKRMISPILITKAATKLKKEMSKDQRKKLLSLLWAVSLSDGSRDLSEERLIEELAKSLDISSLDNNLSKIRATHL